MIQKKKIKLIDLKLMSPGLQIKNKILESYNSLDEFASEIGLYSDTLKQYLRSKNVGSNTFRVKLTQALGMDYNQLVRSEKKQISSNVHQISDNIRQYNTSEDLKILEELREMCIEYTLIKELAMVFRNYGRYYFGKNEILKANENFTIALNYLKQNRDLDLATLYMSELACSHVSSGSMIEAEALIATVEENIDLSNDFDDSIKSGIFYNLGSCYVRSEKSKLGINRFELALKYAPKVKLGMTTLALGLAYKMDGNYAAALKYYATAFDIMENDDSFLYSLYNNIANLHYEMEDYEKACHYIEKIFEELKGNTFFVMNKFFDNYVKIKMKLGQEDQIIDKLNELIKYENLDYIYVGHFMKSIKSIIDLNSKNNQFLGQLKNALMRIINKRHVEHDNIIEQMKLHIGEITVLESQNNF